MSKVHNFSAGPCILPQEVLKQASEAVINFNNLNLSLIEISHRSKDFIAVMEKAQSLVRELLNVPEGYSILFLQGGASLGFLQVPFNFMKVNGKAAYVNTGVWATKAQKEAKGFGEVVEVASSKDKNFNYIPKNYQLPGDADYLHITSNNTIFGTQFKNFPVSRIPVICDMSSDIFSRKIDVSQFDMIYAGAQKNMGPAGTTVFIVKDSALGKTGREIPTMLDFRSHIKGESMFNTPPVFAVYVSMLTLQWLKDNGGVEWIEGINQQKADLLYNEIDANPMFEGTANKADRSNMNATFVLKDESLSEEFNKMWKAANISGIVGHRDVGGYRASMYNALPLESVQALVDVMKAFAVKFG
ncbi:MAG: 3-phosphoserine/phosphohydroxythreonine transaminase [Flavobacteriales bacterium]|nr:3-phosphoserine/phosphohydroxythreonine transaminase [Flavobacteriales bacterium]